MSNEESETFDLPGIGELKTRKGTSTAELAGAVKYWHDRWQEESVTPHRIGFLRGLLSSGFIFLIGNVVYYLWR